MFHVLFLVALVGSSLAEDLTLRIKQNQEQEAISLSFEDTKVSLHQMKSKSMHEVVLFDPDSFSIFVRTPGNGPCTAISCESLGDVKQEIQNNWSIEPSCECSNMSDWVVEPTEEGATVFEAMVDADGFATFKDVPASLAFVVEVDEDTVVVAGETGASNCAWEVSNNGFRTPDQPFPTEPMDVEVYATLFCAISIQFQASSATEQSAGPEPEEGDEVDPSKPLALEGIEFTLIPLLESTATFFTFALKDPLDEESKAATPPMGLQYDAAGSLVDDTDTADAAPGQEMLPSYNAKQYLLMMKQLVETGSGSHELVRSSPKPCASQEVTAELASVSDAYSSYTVVCDEREVMIPDLAYRIGMISNTTNRAGKASVVVPPTQASSFLIMTDATCPAQNWFINTAEDPVSITIKPKDSLCVVNQDGVAELIPQSEVDITHITTVSEPVEKEETKEEIEKSEVDAKEKEETNEENNDETQEIEVEKATEKGAKEEAEEEANEERQIETKKEAKEEAKEDAKEDANNETKEKKDVKITKTDENGSGKPIIEWGVFLATMMFAGF